MFGTIFYLKIADSGDSADFLRFKPECVYHYSTYHLPLSSKLKYLVLLSIEA